MSQAQPPRRFIAGMDVITVAEQKAAALQQQAKTDRAIAMTLAHDAA